MVCFWSRTVRTTDKVSNELRKRFLRSPKIKICSWFTVPPSFSACPSRGEELALYLSLPLPPSGDVGDGTGNLLYRTDKNRPHPCLIDDPQEESSVTTVPASRVTYTDPEPGGRAGCTHILLDRYLGNLTIVHAPLWRPSA